MTKQKIIAGIDYSMTCPAICIFEGESFSFENCTFYYLISTKKYQGVFGNITGSDFPKDYTCEIERFDNIAQFFYDKIVQHKCTHVAIEGYSMGSRGKVFNIAENTALLKYKLWKANIPVILPAPKTIKKSATDNGNAGKDLMYETFTNNTKTNIIKRLAYEKKDVDSPVGDIVDSYFICEYLFTHS